MKTTTVLSDSKRIDLASQRAGQCGSAKAVDLQRAQTWLEGWQKLGAEIEGKAVTTESCVSLLEADRGPSRPLR